ncbi:patatin-like phospholipase family protein [Neiella marina]|uniref:Patatin-like phospholipase family protein n=1 Tax=Neiella holothuriorum TaxID=2870530 RepID=A0ABS7EE30_9GAMM|nr:DUF6363 domain-containing protein [Neiella holothuriorum]MBW8190505.1 patatin-like phospholipase family protein [Neiella holothuriorum]
MLSVSTLHDAAGQRMQRSNKSTTHFAKPLSGLGLVAEGGGQRGVFTAGVLDSWQLAGFNPFEVLVGTSAGAQNIASFLSQQTGYAYSLIADLTVSSDFFNPWRVLTGKNAMDLDWYFGKAATDSYQFDTPQAHQNAKGRTVRFSSSNPKNFATRLIDPLQEGWLNSLRYSSAIPYLYKSDSLIDGGVTAPIPVQEAHALGAQTIVTIRTTSGAQHAMPKLFDKIKPLVCNKNHCLHFMRMLKQHQSACEQAEHFISQPPAQVTVFEIKPEIALRTKVLGSSHDDIVADYKQGFSIGMRFIKTHQHDLMQGKRAVA